MASRYNLDLNQTMALFNGAHLELERQIKMKLMEQAAVIVEEAAKTMAANIQTHFNTEFSVVQDSTVINLFINHEKLDVLLKNQLASV